VAILKPVFNWRKLKACFKMTPSKMLEAVADFFAQLLGKQTVSGNF